MSHLTEAKATAKLQSVGWDGRSNPIIELRATGCECRWTQDGHALLGVCLGAITEQVKEMRDSA